MYCEKCGNHLNVGEEKCSTCQECNEGVQVLTSEEKDNFKGLTIDNGDNSQEREYRSHSYSNSKQRIYVKHSSFDLGSTSLITKLVIAGVVVFMVFVALPIVFLVLGLVLVFLFLTRRSR
ncbi:hypothetical protein [Dendrosporobacter sp. 1207_IL3150]|uniref:hypothetical protein n=1 Tax=Dendrosporobacter sp. 1207_IL3150 TaxID=3084054 RepID=UPI002FD933F9